MILPESTREADLGSNAISENAVCISALEAAIAEASSARIIEAKVSMECPVCNVRFTANCSRAVQRISCPSCESILQVEMDGALEQVTAIKVVNQTNPSPWSPSAVPTLDRRGAYPLHIGFSILFLAFCGDLLVIAMLGIPSTSLTLGLALERISPIQDATLEYRGVWLGLGCLVVCVLVSLVVKFVDEDRIPQVMIFLLLTHAAMTTIRAAPVIFTMYFFLNLLITFCSVVGFIVGIVFCAVGLRYLREWLALGFLVLASVVPLGILLYVALRTPNQALPTPFTFVELNNPILSFYIIVGALLGLVWYPLFIFFLAQVLLRFEGPETSWDLITGKSTLILGGIVLSLAMTLLLLTIIGLGPFTFFIQFVILLVMKSVCHFWIAWIVNEVRARIPIQTD